MLTGTQEALQPFLPAFEYTVIVGKIYEHRMLILESLCVLNSDDYPAPQIIYESC